jgi:hypothetical protein
MKPRLIRARQRQSAEARFSANNSNALTAKQWAERINTSWQDLLSKTLEGIFAIGHQLLAAKGSSMWCECAPTTRALHARSFLRSLERPAPLKSEWPMRTMLRRTVTQQ